MKYTSPILSQARASLGGATFSANRGGNYIRARIAPVQPRSTAQQQARAQFSTVSGNWKTLTAAQRAGWAAAAAGVTLQDSLGNSYIPTGNQLYVGLNRNLLVNGEPVVSASPGTKPDFPNLVPITVTAAAAVPALTLVTQLTSAPTGFIFEVSATAQVSPGVSFFSKSAYRFIASATATSFASLNMLAPYNTRWGTLVAGERIGLRLRMVQISTGWAGTPATVSVIVGT